MSDENDIIAWRGRYDPVLYAAVRLLGAGLLPYIFVVVLMTTTAQSAAVAQLKGTEYSAAYAALTAADAAKTDFDSKALGRASDAWNAADRANTRAGEDYKDAVDQLKMIVVKLDKSTLCDLGDPEAIRPGSTGHLFDRLKACVANTPAMPPELRADATATLDGRKDATDAATRWVSAFVHTADEKVLLDHATADATRVQGLQDGVKDIRAAFAPVAVLRDKWLLGGGILVQLPPAMMQIVSAFFSGMFGALLLTLVLIVYPNVKIGITTPGGNYGERILLGGLIAICVLIVLSGGTAVLGSGNAFSDGTANVQAFSAIGVLAGMFSDRVAQWLSTRATSFFGDAAQKSVVPAPSPTPPQLPAPGGKGKA